VAQKKIVVVGGGSAGWMAAAFLARVYSRDGEGFRVSLVESAEVPTIGVGEATIQDMRLFLGALGVSEGEFLATCDATLKHGILFRDWVGDGREPDQFFHAFESSPAVVEEEIVNHWLNASMRGATSDSWGRWSGIQCAAAANNRSPKSFADADFTGTIPYGYHLDANKFAHFLKGFAKSRGVEHLLGTLAEVEQDDQGHIRSIETSDGRRIEGDIFIDCTGFASILMEKVGAKYVPYGDRLLVDAAVTARVPSLSRDEPLRPYTTATAREHGWTFEIDLPKRRGLGYSYSSRHQDRDGAERAFREMFPGIHDELSVNHFHMKIGRLEQSWVKNCVAIGLSAGFIEPLESTGLHFITTGLRYLVSYLDPEVDDYAGRDWYNDYVVRTFDDAVNFVQLHYLLSKRRDTEFWRDATEKTHVSDILRERMNLWARKAPSPSDFIGEPIFAAPSYSAVLYGMGHLPDVVPAITRGIPTETSLKAFGRLEQVQRRMVEALPRHEDFLKKTVSTFL
jgi:tryptophan halogenase